MTPKQQQAIDDIMDYFDFKKVEIVMHELNWRWAGAEFGLPTERELKVEARRLLRDAIEEKAQIATGGFQAVYEQEDGGEYIALKFVLQEWGQFIENE